MTDKAKKAELEAAMKAATESFADLLRSNPRALLGDGRTFTREEIRAQMQAMAAEAHAVIVPDSKD